MNKAMGFDYSYKTASDSKTRSPGFSKQKLDLRLPAASSEGLPFICCGVRDVSAGHGTGKLQCVPPCLRLRA